MARNDGGPAFPRRLPDISVPPDEALRVIKQHEGMSLRDWFAGQALIGIGANYTFDDNPSRSASTAYALAEAMLVERAKGGD